MISREFGNGGWAAGCSNAPPPLHVYDTESEAAQWYPPVRPALFPQPPGPIMVKIPSPVGGGEQLGDDPTDPARQSRKRFTCNGMIGRLNVPGGAGG
jgi:hypothetical protein